MVSEKSQIAGDILESSQEHLDAMADIFKHGQEQHHEAFPDVFCAADNHDEIVRYIRTFLKPGNPFRTRRNFSLVWILDNELRGYMLYQLYETSNVFFGKKRWTCFVEDIAVDPDYRSLGGASMLVDYLTVKLDGLGDCIASAQVWKGNDASEALFRKYGFDDLSKTFYRTIA